jgi:hypothetical protein
MRKTPVELNFHGLKPVAVAATGFACLPLAGNFIYGLKPVELQRNIKLWCCLESFSDIAVFA